MPNNTGKTKKKSKKSGSGTRKNANTNARALPKNENLRLEIACNDLYKGTRGGALMKFLEHFVEKGEFNDIPVYLNETVDNNYVESYIMDNIEEEYRLCKELIEVEDIYISFRTDWKPERRVLITLWLDDKIIGVCMFALRNMGMGNKTPKQELHLYVDYLCGSIYKGVGTILVNLLKAMMKEYKAKSMYMESLSSAVPFYRKKGFKVVSNEYNTTYMEFRQP
jgi:hypothetical protein